MTTLTVFKFPDPFGAEEMLNKIYALQQQQLLVVQDAATVSWPVGKKGPKTKQAVNLAGAGALDGAFWGLLFGLIFFVPFFGLAIGAAMGALSGKMADYGISDDFIKRTQEQVIEGTSALFLMSSNEVKDQVVTALKGLDFELIASNLSKEQEAELMTAFSKE